MTTLITFANQSGQIPLSELDTNFATPITIGTTPIILGQTAGTITGLTLAGANLGTPTGNLANCTFPILNQNTTGTASNVTGVVIPGNGGTGVTTSTGSGSNVLNTSPTLITPLLGIPTSGTLTTCTGLPLTTGITGILPVLNGGTGVTTPAIVAGTGIGVSGTWPNQTINSTAAGTVTGVTATAPVTSTGGNAPVIAMAAATTSVNGYLTSTDWNTFNGKQVAGSYITSGGALGTPSSGTLTNCSGTANSLNAGIGVNQTWQDVSASRAINTTYYNSTGKPIQVMIQWTSTSATATMTINGLSSGIFSYSNGGQTGAGAICIIIPNGNSYSANHFSEWLELR